MSPVAGWRRRRRRSGTRPRRHGVGATAVLAAIAVVSSISPRGAGSADPPRSRWSEAASLPAAFGPRWDVSSAYFPPAGEVVLFGGGPAVLSGAWRNDTWVYSSGGWTPGPAAPPGLTPRGGAAMAYDPDIERIVLFGGGGGAWPPSLDDTWLFDGTSWAPGPRAPAGLTAREGAGLAYDPDVRRMVLLAGSGLEAHTDTWLFDGTSWTPGPLAPPRMPPREYFGMAYDPIARRMVVAGGSGGTDTWLFDGTSWTPGPALPPGPARERFYMAFDPNLGGVVVFGGIGPGGATNGAWLFRDGGWRELPVSGRGAPSPRLDAAVLWDAREGALMVVGGVTDTEAGTAALTDAWFLGPSGP